MLHSSQTKKKTKKPKKLHGIINRANLQQTVLLQRECFFVDGINYFKIMGIHLYLIKLYARIAKTYCYFIHFNIFFYKSAFGIGHINPPLLCIKPVNPYKSSFSAQTLIFSLSWGLVDSFWIRFNTSAQPKNTEKDKTYEWHASECQSGVQNWLNCSLM